MFNFLKRKKTLDIYTPIEGKILNLNDVPDQVFSEKMLGDGLALEPEGDRISSPFEGEVVTIFPTNHAIGLKSKEGIELLIHIGIDTVELDGKGFERLVSEGEKIDVGTPLIRIDRETIKKSAKSLITPVIITNMDRIESIERTETEQVGDESIIMTLKLK